MLSVRLTICVKGPGKININRKYGHKRVSSHGEARQGGDIIDLQGSIYALVASHTGKSGSRWNARTLLGCSSTDILLLGFLAGSARGDVVDRAQRGARADFARRLNRRMDC